MHSIIKRIIGITLGEFAGREYDAMRDHFACTLRKAEDADPGPAMPPKHEMN